MKRFLLVPLLLIGCATNETLTVREYDAGRLLVRYKAPTRIDPVFTHISRVSADREDGAIYITADSPGGVFGTNPGRSFSLYLLPVDRFGLTHPDLSELALSLPQKLEENHPREKFLAQVRDIMSRRWCEVSSCKAASAEAITGVSYYSYADSEHFLYVSWNFPSSISKTRFLEEERARIEILNGIDVRKKEPIKIITAQRASRVAD